MQYRLRTLWLVVAVIGVIVAIALAVTEDLRKRGRLTAELTALGAYYVAFDDNNEPDWMSWLTMILILRTDRMQFSSLQEGES